MRQLRDYQDEAIHATRTEWSRGIIRTVIVHATGLGKLHPDTTEIQTPDGLRQFSDLAIGDHVFGSDGKPTTVTGVYPNGVMPVYRVHFSDSTSVLAGAEHLWKVKGRSHTCATRIMTTAQLMATDLHAGPSWRWRIPMTDAVVRPDADLPIPPYTLGALIANGCLHCKGQPALTTPDYEVIANIEAEGVPTKWLNKGPNSTCPAWALPTTRASIRTFGLDVPSGRKFIPSIYLEASIDQRIALLQGLMDADGSSRIGGRRSVNYHTTSAQLAADVQELVWSLGGTASCNAYDRTAEGKPVEMQIHILTPANLYPFGTMRKAQATKPRRTFTPRRAIVAITAEGTARSRCIRVSASDSLYLIGREYIVTHNTSIIAKLATDEAAAGGRVLLLAHRSEPLDQMTDCCLETDPTVSVGRVQAERNEVNHRIIVASVQTLCHDKRLAQLPKPTMVIIDECFPAGTIVGNTPIEQIRTGDLVPSWDEITNQPVQRRVTATMRSVPSSLVRVQTENESIVCTPGHPFLTTSGWVPAIELNHGAYVLSSTYDTATSLLHRVQSSIRSTQPAQGKMADLAQTTTSVLSRQLPSLLGASTEAEAKNTETHCSLYSLRRSSQLSRTAKTSIPRMAEYWTSLLRESMPRCLGKSAFVSYNDQDESQALFSSNDQEQPYARCRNKSESLSNTTRNEAQTSITWRQWRTNASSTASTRRVSRLAHRSNLHNVYGRASLALQTRHCASNDESLCRSRWSITQHQRSPSSRQEARRTADLSRVVSVQILEPSSDGTYGGVCPRGVVYNLEVEGTHTYRVGRSGLVAHNCHHGMAASYIKILRWAGSFETTRTLGVTATLVRGDGRGFGELFQSVADSKGIDWAVRHRWLVLPRGKAVLLRNLDLAAMTVRHGDYADSELGPVIDAGSEAIVKAWMNNAGDRITVAFTPTIASAQALRNGFLAQGVPAEVVLGSTPRDDRKAIYARLAAGETRVLVSVMVTTEAWDCPPVSCVLMARPTALPGLYQQMMGRGLRLAEGKTDCLVLDVVGVSRGQKLVTLVNMVPSALYDDSEIRPRRRRAASVRPRMVQRVRDWLFSRGF